MVKHRFSVFVFPVDDITAEVSTILSDRWKRVGQAGQVGYQFVYVGRRGRGFDDDEWGRWHGFDDRRTSIPV